MQHANPILFHLDPRRVSLDHLHPYPPFTPISILQDSPRHEVVIASPGSLIRVSRRHDSSTPVAAGKGVVRSTHSTEISSALHVPLLVGKDNYNPGCATRVSVVEKGMGCACGGPRNCGSREPSRRLPLHSFRRVLSDHSTPQTPRTMK